MDQALSIYFLLGWLGGDLLNLIGSFLADQLPLQVPGPGWLLNTPAPGRREGLGAALATTGSQRLKLPGMLPSPILSLLLFPPPGCGPFSPMEMLPPSPMEMLPFSPPGVVPFPAPGPSSLAGLLPFSSQQLLPAPAQDTPLSLRALGRAGSVPVGASPPPGQVPQVSPACPLPAGVHGHLLRAGRPGDALPLLLLPAEEQEQSV